MTEHPAGRPTDEDKARADAAHLHTVWRRARADLDVITGAENWDYIDAVHEEEQRTFDRLVDYVEAHELNGSEWDPRNPSED